MPARLCSRRCLRGRRIKTHGLHATAIAWNKRLNPRPLPVAKPKQVRPHLLAPRIRLTNPFNLNMGNWVLTLGEIVALWASRCFRSEFRRIVLAWAARTASVLVGCRIGCGVFAGLSRSRHHRQSLCRHDRAAFKGLHCHWAGGFQFVFSAS